jgi:putative SOS response-associated peptidase YedK
MPVILPGPAAERAWLDNGVGPAAHQQLLVPYNTALMKEYAITTRVNSPAHNDPEVLAAA